MKEQNTNALETFNKATKLKIIVVTKKSTHG
jgi:hypothetical protein